MMTDETKKPVWRITSKMRERSRALRRDMTNAERKIWYALRAHRFFGAGFRRQTPIGPYIVDFVSHQSRLVIEIDGGQHFDGEQLRSDRRRDAYLKSEGYRILRFTNLDVLTNAEGVFEIIAAELESAPSLPSPASGGGDSFAQAAPHDVPRATARGDTPLPSPPPQGGRGSHSQAQIEHKPARGEARK